MGETVNSYLTVAAMVGIVFAITGATFTGNFVRVQVFLSCHMLHTLGTGWWTISGWGDTTTAYFWFYTALTVPLLLSEMYIAFRALDQCPPRLQDRFFMAAIVAAVAVFMLAVRPERSGVLMALQVFVLTFAGILTRAAAENFEDGTTAAPYRTLGTLWLVQAIMFFLYAKGVTADRQPWEAIGNALPKVVMLVGMLALGREMLRVGATPLHEVHK